MLGHPLNDQQLDAALKDLDVNKDGVIDLNEFTFFYKDDEVRARAARAWRAIDRPWGRHGSHALRDRDGRFMATARMMEIRGCLENAGIKLLCERVGRVGVRSRVVRYSLPSPIRCPLSAARCPLPAARCLSAERAPVRSYHHADDHAFEIR